jgi:3-deoxy-D-manno-octulosonic-acid transferase
LPLDTKKKAKKFLKTIRPELVFFIKYEFWPNYLNELKKQNIPTYLISGIFREGQAFFKWYGCFYRKALDTFSLFFVQNENSKNLLLDIGKKNVIVSGDTRFDRVATILEKDNTLDFIAAFKNEKLLIVAGSTWSKDEDLLLNFINNQKQEVKLIIAPHNIKTEQIQELKDNCTKKIVLFSEKDNKNLADYDVFIIDTFGILTKIYSYADIAYVGGGFGNPGIHNILEPATFGIPILIGPNYSHFSEAIALMALKGCFSISKKEELNGVFQELISNESLRNKIGAIASSFAEKNKGATNTILKNIIKL